MCGLFPKIRVYLKCFGAKPCPRLLVCCVLMTVTGGSVMPSCLWWMWFHMWQCNDSCYYGDMSPHGVAEPSSLCMFVRVYMCIIVRCHGCIVLAIPR